jgi:hypothetical protein
MTRARTPAGPVERPGRASPVRTASAREALVVEAISDAAQLLESLERVVPALDKRCAALKQAGTTVDQRLEVFGRQLSEASQRTRVATVVYVVERTKAMAARAIEEQNTALTEAGQRIFSDQVGTTCSI